MDTTLTLLGNALEEWLEDPGLGPVEFSDIEDLVLTCRQAASLQPDGTKQPTERCSVKGEGKGTGGGSLVCNLWMGLALAPCTGSSDRCIRILVFLFLWPFNPPPGAVLQALVARLLEVLHEAASLSPGSTALSPGAVAALSPETEAGASHVLRLLRTKLDELRAAHAEQSFGRSQSGGGALGGGSLAGSGTSTPASVSIDDFEIIKPISRGAFGRVYLARKKATGELFAIKVRGRLAWRQRGLNGV